MRHEDAKKSVYCEIISLGTEKVNSNIEIRGWVRTIRTAKTICFINVNDGSTISGIQLVVDKSHLSPHMQETVQNIHTGTSITAAGVLIATPHLPQPFEIQCISIALLGTVPPETYPLQKKQHSNEFLRSIPHLRIRSTTFLAISRVRNALSNAIHTYFQSRNYIHLHAPIITTHDAEGAGELFHVHAHTREMEHFFGASAYLSVSGQLNAESYALAHGKVYTFGPTFRAEDSHTARHLSEFWMVEPEIAFCNLEKNMQIAEECVRTVIREALTTVEQEICLINKEKKDSIAQLTALIAKPFAILTYREAMRALTHAEATAAVAFEHTAQYGKDLQTEHEKWLISYVGGKPVFIINYPKEIKAFYMRLNDDNTTVAAMDLLLPFVGELIGGSQREERYDLLYQRMRALNIDVDAYQWYLDLRKYGTVIHSGFGLGFDRLVQFVCGLDNIRDVVPFPRSAGTAHC